MYGGRGSCMTASGGGGGGRGSCMKAGGHVTGSMYTHISIAEVSEKYIHMIPQCDPSHSIHVHQYLVITTIDTHIGPSHHGLRPH